MTPYLEGFARARATDIVRKVESRHIVEMLPGRDRESKRKLAGRRLVLLGRRLRREHNPGRKVA